MWKVKPPMRRIVNINLQIYLNQLISPGKLKYKVFDRVFDNERDKVLIYHKGYKAAKFRFVQEKRRQKLRKL